MLVIPFCILVSGDVDQSRPQYRTSGGQVAVVTVSQSRAGCSGGQGQKMGLLRSVVAAFLSLPLLKVWMELSKAVRPPPAPSEEDRRGGGQEEESSVGGGGGGGGGGGAVWAPG